MCFFQNLQVAIPRIPSSDTNDNEQASWWYFMVGITRDCRKQNNDSCYKSLHLYIYLCIALNIITGQN